MAIIVTVIWRLFSMSGMIIVIVSYGICHCWMAVFNFLMSFDDTCHCQMRGDYYHCKRRNIIITINVTKTNVNKVSQMTVYM